MESSSGSSDSPLLAKSVAMVTLFTISLMLGVLPMIIANKYKWQKNNLNKNKYAQILLSIGGGVLMATTFIHLLPEISENIEKVEQFQNAKFPIAETLTCIGFFLIYFVEELVHLYLHKQEPEPEVDFIRRSVSVLRGEVCNPDARDNELVMTISDLENQIRLSKLSSKRNSQNLIRLRKSIDFNPRLSHQHDHHTSDNAHSGHSHNHVVGDEKFLGSFRGLLVVLALSVHEIMEGLSVGLESKSKNVWYMFAAVGAHKFIIAFCVGVELLSSGIKNKMIFIYVFVFAVVSPIGIAIGIGISFGGENSSEIPSIILQGFATGTLVYVIFFEILKKNVQDGNGLNKYIAVLVGFIVMFFTTVFITDGDD